MTFTFLRIPYMPNRDLVYNNLYVGIMAHVRHWVAADGLFPLCLDVPRESSSCRPPSLGFELRGILDPQEREALKTDLE